MLRTDMAIEKKELENGFFKREERLENMRLCHLQRKDEKYITIDFVPLEKMPSYEELEEEIIKALKELSPKEKNCILVVGLGNREITPDSVGPLTANRLLATRHISASFAEQIGLKGIKSVAVLSPNVLGKTGIETAEIIKAVTDRIRPDLIIAVDALASSSSRRLFCSVQLSNQGISPGSGVKNKRAEISQKTLSVPVISVGVPTVVDAKNIVSELTGEEVLNDEEMILTPKDADLLSHRISEILSRSINAFLQPEIEREVLFSLV